jgi:carboxyl-terminal processing protease
MYYVDDIKPGDVMKTGIDAMLESLDPYTNYIPESDIEDYRFMTTGQYGGIGAVIRNKDKDVIIAEPYEGFPAHKAGLMAGDVILEIDHQSVAGKSTTDISKILKGEPGTNVSVLIKREGHETPIEKQLIREEIQVNSVPYYGVISDSIGYIKLSSFTEKSGSDVKRALVALKDSAKIKSLIFDLRENPGGLLREAIDIVNLFVDKGKEIVSTKGKVKEWAKEYRSLNFPVDVTMPVAVLVNSGSASASEIVSGSLQDLDRGVIIGQLTYGKGLVQTTRPLSYNTQLKVTTAKYYIPSGRCIQARDYAHRNEDGSVGKIADSLKVEFKTQNGRTVYDGGGVDPDIKIEQRKLSKITISLLSKNLIFDYATLYRLKHENIAPAKQFKLSEKDYDEFITFLSDKEYDYTTESEETLQKLKGIAETEKYYDNIRAEYDNLYDKLKHNKKDDLYKFREEIKELLTEEIVSRYYYQNGRIENSISNDSEVKEAIAVLKDKNRYNTILTAISLENGNKK